MSDIRISFPEILYLFGTFHGIFLAVLLAFSQRAHRANIYLSLLLILFSFYLFENTLYSSGYMTRFPHMLFTTIPLIYLIGPLFYTYTRSLLNRDFKLRAADALLLIPFLLELSILAPVFVLSADIKQKIYQNSLNSTTDWNFSIYFLGYIIYVITSLLCFYASFRLLAKAKQETAAANMRITWLKQASLALFGYVSLSMILSVLLMFDNTFRMGFFHVNLILQMLLIQGVGYAAFIRPSVFRDLPENGNGKKYRFSSLDPAAIAGLKGKLIEWMETGPYVDPDISPELLAAKLGISRHHLSQLLTEGLHTNFYDLVNKYRVEKAKQLMLLDDYRDAKILHIAYDCGFSNKSTFLRSFKKLTGQTPTEFRSRLENQVSLN